MIAHSSGSPAFRKPQVVYGRIYQTIDDVRAAVSEFSA
jgi:hypothetical protein